MEAAEIIGVVAASLQFLEFGFKLVTKTIQIKNSTSGLTYENANLLDIANDLNQYADLMSARWRNYSGKRPLEDHEKFLEEAVKDCQQISNEMQKEIRKCSRKGRHTWGALNQAFETITKGGSVKSFAKRLEVAKEKITMANLVCICDDGRSSRLSLEQIQHQLEQLTRSIQKGSSRFEESLGFDVNGSDDPALATEALKGPSATFQTTWGALDSNNPILDTLFEELVDKIWNPSWDPNSAKHEDFSPTFLDNFKDYIVRSLRFDEMQKREQEIKDTFEATFEWIWDIDPVKDHGNPAWSSFPGWLECNKGNLYWITGVPGSGKSTLMKYIQHNSKDHLVHHLGKWKPDTPLLILHYYAWNAGLDELKSCEGLLRTILAQGLETEPNVIPHVFKRRLALFGTLSPKALQDFELLPQKPWRLSELRESLQFFMRELDGRRKLVIFVDGLDEFEVPPKEVVTQIRGLCSESRVKVCVASRPWIEFEETLKPCPHLRIDELTSNDISAYIKGRLEVQQAFIERDFEVSDLTKQIREKAQGVFLWVYLVVEHMLPGLEGGISLAALQQAIDELPDEIHELYNVMWRRIPQELKSDASKLFQLFYLSGSTKDMLRMWLAYEGKTPSYDFELQEDRYTTIRSITIRRLNTHARGILKLSDTNVITVAHKTAYEWMRQTEVRNEMSSTIPPLYNPALRLMNASIIFFNCHRLLKDKFANLEHILTEVFSLACSIYSPDTTYQKGAGVDIESADNILLCFKEFEVAVKSWEATNDAAWRSRVEMMKCPNFVSLVAHLGVIDYLRSLEESDPGMFLTSIESQSTRDDETLFGFNQLLLLHDSFKVGFTRHESYFGAKLECVKLFLSEIPGKDADGYCTILRCGLVVRKKIRKHFRFAKEAEYYNKVWEHIQQCAKERGFEKRLERDLELNKRRRFWMWFGLRSSVSTRRHLLFSWK